MKKTLLLAILIFGQIYALPSKDSINKKRVRIIAVRTTEQIDLNGILSEKVWSNSDSISDFTQRDPNEGETPSQRTVVRIAYDDQNIYIAARMYDTNPDSIQANLARRDNDANSDQFMVFLDPYNDKRTGYYFGITAAGTLKDGVLYNDSWDDNSWDGVWEGKANIDKDGWTAEIKIPFSQLKFKSADIQTWGVDFRRDIARNHELDYLVYIPKKESGFVSHFFDLTGIKDIKPSNKLEILPYLTSRAAYTAHDAGDPFNNGSQYSTG
ncbi:MAG TPA: carbohydrate binding family 9 domain-containing protein, partial [Ignavibacteriaceae bacterium]|nr:carbohydrate binding family 9 domain-containing protein [Ignavibacteriaceae bacterium]